MFCLAVFIWRIVEIFNIMLGPNKKIISVFRVTGLTILGRVGTHVFFSLEKIYNVMHFERHFAFQYS